MKPFHYVPSKDFFVKKFDDDQTIARLKIRFKSGDYFSLETISELMEFARLVKLYPHLEKEFKAEAKLSYFEKQLGSFGQIAVPGVDAVRHLAGLCFYELFKAGRDDKVASDFLHEYLIASVEYHVTVAVNALAGEAVKQSNIRYNFLEKALLAAAPEHGVVGYAILASYYSQLAEACWAEAELLAKSSCLEEAITQLGILTQRGNALAHEKFFMGAVSLLLLERIEAGSKICNQVHQSLVANFEEKSYEKLCWSQPYLQEALQEYLAGFVSIERQRAERAATDVADKAFQLLATSVSVVGHGSFFQMTKGEGPGLNGAAAARRGVGL